MSRNVRVVMVLMYETQTSLNRYAGIHLGAELLGQSLAHEVFSTCKLFKTHTSEWPPEVDVVAVLKFRFL